MNLGLPNADARRGWFTHPRLKHCSPFRLRIRFSSFSNFMKSIQRLCSVALLWSVATALPAATLSFTGNLSTFSDVAVFNFTLASPSTVTIRSLGYAGGTNAAGNVIPAGGFDPILTLSTSAGSFLTQNDDANPASLVGADPITGGRFDSFIQTSLGAGSYKVSVAAFSLTPPAFVDATGATRNSAWAVDVLGITVAPPTGVPDSGSAIILMLLGMTALFGISRRLRVA